MWFIFLSKLVQMKDFTNCRNGIGTILRFQMGLEPTRFGWNLDCKGGEIKFGKCFMKLSGSS